MRAAGAWAYLAAWDVHRARLFGRCEARTGIVAFDRLVEQVMSQEPYRSARRVFWVMDNRGRLAAPANALAIDGRERGAADARRDRSRIRSHRAGRADRRIVICCAWFGSARCGSVGRPRRAVSRGEIYTGDSAGGDVPIVVKI